jgi:carbon storage regulator
MLVLSRKPGERILIGDKIAITVVRIAPGIVRIGVEAPAELPILREELANGHDTSVEAAVPPPSPSPVSHSTT